MPLYCSLIRPAANRPRPLGWIFFGNTLAPRGMLGERDCRRTRASTWSIAVAWQLILQPVAIHLNCCTQPRPFAMPLRGHGLSDAPIDQCEHRQQRQCTKYVRLTELNALDAVDIFPTALGSSESRWWECCGTRSSPRPSSRSRRSQQFPRARASASASGRPQKCKSA